MLVLGLNLFHSDSSATLLVDGEVVFAVAEERLNRVKHFGGVPVLAIQACLDSVGASLSDVDHVAIGRNPDVHQTKRLLYGLRNPAKIPNLARLRKRGQGLKNLRALMGEALEVDPAALRFQEHFVEHHLAHLASAFLCSDMDSAAGLSLDGSGDFVSTMFARCEGQSIEVLHRVFIPHSLGTFYTMVCDFIGYRSYGDEGKVMGLAALGSDALLEQVRRIVRPDGNGFKLDLDYFVPMGSNMGIEVTPSGAVHQPRLFGDRMVRAFGAPREIRSEITARDMDLAYAVQARYEEIFFHVIATLERLVRERNLVIAGGCALNSVANGKIFTQSSFERTWIQPAAGDEGLSLGAALWVWCSTLGKPRTWQMRDAYLGPGFASNRMKAALEAAGLAYQELDRETLLDETARLISEGKVIGWFQGRMEWGPRALGNRSILAHPGRPDMKDALNARIKHREWFRPFAPSILEEYLGEYFTHDHPSPYMLHVYSVRPEKRDLLPAVVHVDGTGRLQSVSRDENELYYDLIDRFRRLTGLPVLLNTSFNENEPICCTPEEAVDTFVRTKMDVLALGNLLVVAQR